MAAVTELQARAACKDLPRNGTVVYAPMGVVPPRVWDDMGTGGRPPGATVVRSDGALECICPGCRRPMHVPTRPHDLDKQGFPRIGPGHDRTWIQCHDCRGVWVITALKGFARLGGGGGDD